MSRLMSALRAADLLGAGPGILLVLLLAGDGIFILLAGLSRAYLKIDLLSLGYDRSYSEFYQYMKFVWIAILLSMIGRGREKLYLLGWVLLFVYFLLDDALQIHETGGTVVAEWLRIDAALNLRAKDFGEIIVSLAAGLLIFVPIAWAWIVGPSWFRALSIDLAVLVGLLVVFGVGVDAVHMMVRPLIPIDYFKYVDFLVGVLEDGGEMVAVSLLTWYAYARATLLQGQREILTLHGMVQALPRQPSRS
jgi:hypothetical protein